MYSQFDIDRSKYNLSFPESIVRTDEWTKHYACANCNGDIEENHLSLHRINEDYPSYVSVNKASCPHCKVVGPHSLYANLTGDAGKKGNGTIKRSLPIPFKLYWRRVHWTYIPGWWASKIQGKEPTYFYEYTEAREISHEAPEEPVEEKTLDPVPTPDPDIQDALDAVRKRAKKASKMKLSSNSSAAARRKRNLQD